MQQIYYYGSEKVIGTEYNYQLGLYVHNLKPEEEEKQIRAEIEERCRKNVAHMVFCDKLTGKPLRNFSTFHFLN